MGKAFLYSKVFHRLQEQIENGTYKAGDKLPSLRDFSKTQGISLSTAFKAYEELVFYGLVSAREKSGYYVDVQTETPSHTESHVQLKRTNTPIDSAQIVALAQRQMGLKEMVEFSVTSPDVSLLPIKKLNKYMSEALKKDDSGCLRYENIQGNPDLRRYIAQRFPSGNATTSLEEVVITQGCIESLVLCLMTVTQPGDKVIIGKPTYFSIYSILKNLGLTIIEVDVAHETGLNFVQLEDALNRYQISACCFITNFSNPTGHSLTDISKQRLVQLLASHNIPLIEDDIYGDIYFGGSRPLSCKSFDNKGLVLLCSSFSKTLAPGYRIGWCIPGRYLERFLEIKLMHTVSSPSPTQAALALYLRKGRYDLHLSRLRKALYLESLRYRKAILDHFPSNIKVSKPNGGFVLWVELDPKVDGATIFYQALEHDIAIWPGQIFSASEGYKNFIRISFGSPLTETMLEGIKILGDLVKAEMDSQLT